MSAAKAQPPFSPRWSAITKLSVSLAIFALLAVVVVRFHTLLGPVLFAFIVAYLLHPLAAWITRRTPLSWRLTVNIIYLIFVIILGTLLTLGGFELVQQIQNLIGFIQDNVDKLPGYIEDLSAQPIVLGPFELNLAQFDWETIGQEVLGYVEPALGRLGGLAGSLASSAAATLGWLAFIVIVSYFFMIESGGLRERIIQVDIPLYAEDLRRIGQKLSQIWNAFLRGQIILFFLTSFVYAVFLSAMGVRYAVILAFVTGFANFLPYVGPAINWIVIGLVTYFQPSNYLGLPPFGYTALIIVIAVVIDQVFNNLINPRVMASALKVHPAFVLIAALAAANLIGVLGVIIAAPLLATLQLFGTYVLRKMLDRDPWPPEEDGPRTRPRLGLLRRIRARIRWPWKKKPTNGNTNKRMEKKPTNGNTNKRIGTKAGKAAGSTTAPRPSNAVKPANATKAAKLSNAVKPVNATKAAKRSNAVKPANATKAAKLSNAAEPAKRR
jgi:predicted PurR-regulated permease PerM